MDFCDPDFLDAVVLAATNLVLLVVVLALTAAVDTLVAGIFRFLFFLVLA